MHQWGIACQALAVAGTSAAALLLAGCGSVKQSPTTATPIERVWPESPAEPRVSYARSIRSPNDAGLRLLGANWASRLLFNEGKHRSDLVRPFGLALDESNNLCIADPGNATVCFLDRARKTWQSWNKIGSLELVAPVAVAKRAGIFYVADSGLVRVLAFDGKGKLQFQTKEGFERPSGLTILDGKLFVADAAAHKIFVLDLAGKVLSSFGARGTGPGEFNYPTHLATDGKGRLLVTDSMNFRIQIFDSTGRYQKEFGRAGDASGTLSRPKGVAADRQGNIYLVDAVFDNIQIFSEAGEFLLAFGEHGDGPGEFWLPAGIAISVDDQAYVADSYNRRVQVFKLFPPP
jgi:DNA-binding beta-propeller fold protein YncE